jgi:hypothetical protein
MKAEAEAGMMEEQQAPHPPADSRSRSAEVVVRRKAEMRASVVVKVVAKAVEEAAAEAAAAEAVEEKKEKVGEEW